jgi:predicted nucleotidyltransferase
MQRIDEGKRFSVSEENYKDIVGVIKTILNNRKEIIFAYLHGSFLARTNFGDVDIAIYLSGVQEEKFMQYEFKLEQILESAINFPVDIRVLNNAPPSFKYNSIKKGIRLIDKNINTRVDFETHTYKIYFDFLPFRQRYLKEALELEV